MNGHNEISGGRFEVAVQAQHFQGDGVSVSGEGPDKAADIYKASEAIARAEQQRERIPELLRNGTDVTTRTELLRYTDDLWRKLHEMASGLSGGAFRALLNHGEQPALNPTAVTAMARLQNKREYPPETEDETLIRAAVSDALAGLLAAQATMSNLSHMLRILGDAQNPKQ
ncbi:hypothetical protein GCM10020000_84480 [Streptomyces olivoverticillatus]